jgi:ATP-dependent DNA helicase RecQ
VSSTNHCRSQLLLAYFGEKESQRCGKCDVCIERNKLELSEFEFKRVTEQIELLITEKAMTLEEIVENIKGSNDDKIIKAFRWLLDNDKITTTEDNRFVWIKKGLFN